MRAPRPSQASQFVHPALLYACDEDYLAELVPFITDGLACAQPVAVAVPQQRLRVLRAALGDAADHVTMIDMAEAGRNPGWIIPGVLRRFADQYPSVHVRIVGEPIWAGRSPVEYPACAQHEALINVAFAGRDVTIVCPYDTSALDPAVVAEARATHPLLWEAGWQDLSGDYAPGSVLARHNQPLHTLLPAFGLELATAAALPQARRFAAEQARHHGLSEDRLADLELVATELAANSLAHTPGGCRLWIWRLEDHVVCSVADSGHLSDPLAGRHPAPPEQLGGRGLLLINQLADLVRVHTTPDGTTLHALFRFESAM